MTKTVMWLLLGITLVANSAQAVRVLEILERSYELRLSDVTLPRTTAEAVGFRPCSGCPYDYMHISGETTWHVGGRTVALVELADEVARIRRTAGAAERTLVVLHYDPDSGVATRVRVESPQL